MGINSHQSLHRVMIIDGCETEIVLTKEILNQVKFCENILEFGNTRAALSYLMYNQYRLFMLPQVIFIDTSVSEMSLFQFVKEYGAMSYVLTNTCKIFITSLENIKEALVFKLDDKNITSFILKPLTEIHLQSIVNLVC